MKASTISLLSLWSNVWIVSAATLSSMTTAIGTSPASSIITSRVGHCGIRCINDCILPPDASLLHGSFCCCSSSTLLSSFTHSGSHITSAVTSTSRSSAIPPFSTHSQTHPIRSTQAPSTHSSAIPSTRSTSTHTTPIRSSGAPPIRSTATSSIASTFTQTFPPSPSLGSTNITVAAFDPRISYMRGDWVNSSACSGQSRSASQAGSTLVFQFFGSAVYMKTKLGANDSVLNITLDGSSVDVTVPGADTGALNCVLAWSAWNLSSSAHTVQVELINARADVPFNSTRPGGSGIAFVLNEFIITQDNAAISSGSGSVSGITTNAPQSSSPALVSRGTTQVERTSAPMALLFGAFVLFVLRGG